MSAYTARAVNTVAEAIDDGPDPRPLPSASAISEIGNRSTRADGNDGGIDDYPTSTSRPVLRCRWCHQRLPRRWLLCGWGGSGWLRWDAIHASPPCQRYSMMSKCRPEIADKYPDLVGPVRDILVATRLPFVPASKAGHWTPGTIMSISGHVSPIAHARNIMAIDWCTREELAEARRHLS